MLDPAIWNDPISNHIRALFDTQRTSWHPHELQTVLEHLSTLDPMSLPDEHLLAMSGLWFHSLLSVLNHMSNFPRFPFGVVPVVICGNIAGHCLNRALNLGLGPQFSGIIDGRFPPPELPQHPPFPTQPYRTLTFPRFAAFTAYFVRLLKLPEFPLLPLLYHSLACAVYHIGCAERIAPYIDGHFFVGEYQPERKVRLPELHLSLDFLVPLCAGLSLPDQPLLYLYARFLYERLFDYRQPPIATCPDLWATVVDSATDGRIGIPHFLRLLCFVRSEPMDEPFMLTFADHDCAALIVRLTLAGQVTPVDDQSLITALGLENHFATTLAVVMSHDLLRPFLRDFVHRWADQPGIPEGWATELNLIRADLTETSNAAEILRLAHEGQRDAIRQLLEGPDAADLLRTRDKSRESYFLDLVEALVVRDVFVDQLGLDMKSVVVLWRSLRETFQGTTSALVSALELAVGSIRSETLSAAGNSAVAEQIWAGIAPSRINKFAVVPLPHTAIDFFVRQNESKLQIAVWIIELGLRTCALIKFLPPSVEEYIQLENHALLAVSVKDSLGRLIPDYAQIATNCKYRCIARALEDATNVVAVLGMFRPLLLEPETADISFLLALLLERKDLPSIVHLINMVPGVRCLPGALPPGDVLKGIRIAATDGLGGAIACLIGQLPPSGFAEQLADIVFTLGVEHSALLAPARNYPGIRDVYFDRFSKLEHMGGEMWPIIEEEVRSLPNRPFMGTGLAVDEPPLPWPEEAKSGKVSGEESLWEVATPETCTFNARAIQQAIFDCHPHKCCLFCAT
jgi:hypothetical protein